MMTPKLPNYELMLFITFMLGLWLFIEVVIK